MLKTLLESKAAKSPWQPVSSFRAEQPPHALRSVYELPGICPVEAPNLDRFQKGRIKVSQIHAMAGTRFKIQRLPMSCAPASFAAYRSERLVALDVLLGIVWMA
jgi:hypothetical protein